MDVDDLACVVTILDDEPLNLFLMNSFLLHQDGLRNIPFNVLRLVYFYHIFVKVRRLHAISIADDFVSRMSSLVKDDWLREILSNRYRESRDELIGALDSLVSNDYENTAYVWLSRLLSLVPDYKQIELYQILEKESRGQAESVVWHAIRTDTVSATRFYEAFVNGNAFIPVEARKPWSSPAMTFGFHHEGVVKTLIEFHIMCGREPVRDGLGLLIDPTSGLFGASLDLCFGVSKHPETGTLAIHPGARVYEIKCRYKYLRKKEDPFVQNVLKRHDLQAVVQFIVSHPIPGVEYRPDCETPSAKEYLLSYDAIFRHTLKRHRPVKAPEALRSHVDDLLYLNKNQTSEVVIFDAKIVSDETFSENGKKDTFSSTSVDAGWGSENDENTPELVNRLDVFEISRFSLPAFVNPRHHYYFQTLIQQYVLSQYYIKKHPDPERIDCRDLPTVFLVSAIFRERDSEELGRELCVGGRVFHCDHVPLFIIVTPVVLDPRFTRHAVSTVLDNWNRSLSRQTNLPIWVPNAAQEYVVSSVPRPPTP
ncbi:deoxyribonuclease [Saimiriine betaherpesvirus 4]|uniref:Deoxyribonuclease n=1 Tax=Saimiriine betaherpesvirus 4 TaxID=1535247 RepID=G8XT02_9BETA|nr:deoxyribonuclease [Saimiriine betaherpesvirus 4]AEV80948.1 deoxyribonuclease [Saimiriine betaherpesvirus 4]